MGQTDKILVLVVDDQEGARAPLVKTLREHGLEVDEADNGRKALAMLTRHHFSVVITDISMPNGNGVELLAKAKKLKQNIRVFLMSDYPDLYADNEGFDLADGVFKKPVRPDEILRAVQEASGHAVTPSSLVA